jgi:hypothetical protein
MFDAKKGRTRPGSTRPSRQRLGNAELRTADPDATDRFRPCGPAEGPVMPAREIEGGPGRAVPPATEIRCPSSELVLAPPID